MKIFLLLSFICLTISSIGQITITDTDFPSPDDTVMISISDELILDLTTTGPNANWDYSNLNIFTQRIDTFNGIWGAPLLYQGVFNNFITDPEYVADYYKDAQFALGGGGVPVPGLEIQNPVVFSKVTNSSVENLGMGLNINGVDVPAKADTIDVQYELPINYSDSWVSNSYLNLDLNPAFNGIFRRYMQRNSIVDGWGQITTAYGTFDVLRVKSFLNYTDSVYVDFGPGGTWFEMPTPDQIEYTWIANGYKIPILTVVTDDDGSGGEVVTRVEFKDIDRGFSSTEKYETEDIVIFPSPASNQINIILNQPNTEISIYDMSGELVFSDNDLTGNLTIDVSEWSRGLYMVKIVEDTKVSSSKFVVQ